MADRRTAQKALELHGSELRGKPNVVGLGIRPADDGSGEALAVYVSRKVAPEALSPQELVPGSVTVDSRSGPETIPVQVIELGSLKSEMP